MNRMRHDNQAIAAAVARLNKRVQQIGKIVEFINGVADKSDLLALNAELEGTKAGRGGAGLLAGGRGDAPPGGERHRVHQGD
jgi:methyl-accepting chemotaxis protein